MLTIPVHNTMMIRTLSIAVNETMTNFQEDFFKLDMPEIKRVFESDIRNTIDDKIIEINGVRYRKSSEETKELNKEKTGNYFIIIRETGTHLFAVEKETTAMILFHQFSEILKSGAAKVYECDFLKDEASLVDVLKDERVNKYF